MIIKLNPDDFQEYFSDQSSITEIEFSKVNVFLGANNCGKSRFVRKILKNQIIKKSLHESINEIENRYNRWGAFKNRELDLLFEKINQNLKIQDVVELIEKIKATPIPSVPDTDYFPIINEYIPFLEKQIESKYEKNIYIPVLRGLRKIDIDSNHDLYKSKTLIDYFEVLKEDINSSDKLNIEIYTGLSFFQDSEKMLLGYSVDRENFGKFEKFLSQSFFNGEDISIIPKKDSDDIILKIGNEADRFIYDLGDGIQSLILLVFPLFMNIGKSVIIGIEEPEIYLHPGFQRKFIELLNREEFNTFTFLITTHSNHFLDTVLENTDITVYSLKKIPGKQAEEPKFFVQKRNMDDAEILTEIGARKSSVFLSNCVIMVEGVTDVKYLRKYFEIFQNDKDTKFIEDLHYSFIEYGGGNITHWDFLDEENGYNTEKLFGEKIFLIADNDNAGRNTKKGKRLEVLKNKLGNARESATGKFWKIEAKEIENILHESVLSRVIWEYENPKEEFDEGSAFDFKHSDYINMNLGKYIEKKLGSNKKRVGSYIKNKGKGNTISEKEKFCDKAIKYINTKENLTKEALDICSALYKFIKNAN